MMQAVLPNTEPSAVKHFIFPHGLGLMYWFWLLDTVGCDKIWGPDWHERWSEICPPDRKYITVVRVTHDAENKRLREEYIMNMFLALRATFPHAIAAEIASHALPTATMCNDSGRARSQRPG